MGQETIAAARDISDLGREFTTVRIMAEHFSRVGKGLEQAGKAYNDAVGSLESRVLVQARRFAELGVQSKKDIPELEPVSTATRTLQAPDLLIEETGPEAEPED